MSADSSSKLWSDYFCNSDRNSCRTCCRNLLCISTGIFSSPSSWTQSSRSWWFSCWSWKSQPACWAWLPGWPCILLSSWAFFIDVPRIYGAKHSSLSKNQNFPKIFPRLTFCSRFQFFRSHELFSVFFLNRIAKNSYAYNFLAWISFRFSKKSWVKNWDSVFCLFTFFCEGVTTFGEI